jgi:hypothetical protein
VIEGTKTETKQEPKQEVKQQAKNEVGTSSENKIENDIRRSNFVGSEYKLVPNSPTDEDLNSYPQLGPQALQEVEVLGTDRRFRLYRCLEQIFGHDGSQISPFIKPNPFASQTTLSMRPFIPSKGIKVAVFFNTASDCNSFAMEYRSKGWAVETHHSEKPKFYNTSITLSNFKNGSTDILFIENGPEVDKRISDVDYIIYYDYPGCVKRYIDNLGKLTNFDKVKSGNVMFVFTMLTKTTPNVQQFVEFLTEGKHEIDNNVKQLAKFGQSAWIDLKIEKPVPLAQVIKEPVIPLPPTPRQDF